MDLVFAFPNSRSYQAYSTYVDGGYEGLQRILERNGGVIENASKSGQFYDQFKVRFRWGTAILVPAAFFTAIKPVTHIHSDTFFSLVMRHLKKG